MCIVLVNYACLIVAYTAQGNPFYLMSVDLENYAGWTVEYTVLVNLACLTAACIVAALILVDNF